MGDYYDLSGLKSSRVEERRFAAMALADILSQPWLDRDHRDITAEIPDLAVALSDKDPSLRMYALKALDFAQAYRQAINPAIPAVVGLLFNEAEQDQEVRRQAADILKEAAKGRHAVFDYTPHLNQLRELLSERNSHVKSKVAYTLAFHFMRRGEWSEVASLLNHRARDVRREAADALSLSSRLDFDFSPVIPDLIKRLSDRSEDVRLAVARALSIGGKQANGKVDFSPAVPVLIDALSGRAVYRLKAADTIRLLILDSCHHEQLRFKAISATSREALAPLIPALKRAIFGANKEVDEIAAVALTQYMAHTQQFEELKVLLDSLALDIKFEVISKLPCASLIAGGCNGDISGLVPILVSLVSVGQGNIGEAARGALRLAIVSQGSQTSMKKRARLIHRELDKAELAASTKQSIKDYLKA